MLFLFEVVDSVDLCGDLNSEEVNRQFIATWAEPKFTQAEQYKMTAARIPPSVYDIYSQSYMLCFHLYKLFILSISAAIRAPASAKHRRA